MEHFGNRTISVLWTWCCLLHWKSLIIYLGFLLIWRFPDTSLACKLVPPWWSHSVLHVVCLEIFLPINFCQLYVHHLSDFQSITYTFSACNGRLDGCKPRNQVNFLVSFLWFTQISVWLEHATCCSLRPDTTVTPLPSYDRTKSFTLVKWLWFDLVL